MVAREQALFFLCTLQAQKFIFGGQEKLIAVTSLFIWQKILYFSPQQPRDSEKSNHTGRLEVAFWG